MEIISYRQSVFLLAMIVPIAGHTMLLPSIFDLSGRDAWIAVLLTIPIGIFLAFIIYRLHMLYPKLTLMELSEKALGRWAGKVINLMFLAYFFFMTFTTFYVLYDFIGSNFMQDTPRWAIAGVFYILVLYAIYLGVESVTRISEALFLIIIFTGTAIAITTQTDKDYSLLFPLFQEGVSPVFMGILLVAAMYGEIILLLMLMLRKGHAKAKSLLFTTNIAILLVAGMALGTVTGALMIFDFELVLTFDYPALKELRYARFGFFERADIYGVVLMVFGCLIRMSIYQMILNKSMRQWTGSNKKWLLHSMILVAVILTAWFGIDNYQHFINFHLTYLYKLSAFISIGIPTCIWISLEIRHRRLPTST